MNMLELDSFQEKEKLMTEFRNGSYKAFRHIFLRYQAYLRYFAVQLIDDAAIAKEMVPGIFETIWKTREEAGNWSILRYRLYSHVAKACSLFLASKIRENTAEGAVINESSPEEWIRRVMAAIVDAECCREMLESLDTLPDLARKIYNRNMHGMEITEVAAELNLSVQHVRDSIATTKIILRNRLKPDFEWVFFFGQAFLADFLSN